MVSRHVRFLTAGPSSSCRATPPMNRAGTHCGGDPSLRMNSDGVPFTAGIFTQVPVKSGAGYRASISWGAPNKPFETGRQLGIDAAGGTDPKSPNVIWGPMHWGEGRILNYPLPDVNIDVMARAAADTLTVFFLVEHPTATVDSLIYIDAIALYPDESAQDDVTPPELVNLNIDPPSIDTSGGPVTLTVSAWFSDDRSGFDSADLSFRPLAGSTTEQARLLLEKRHRMTGTLGMPLYRNTLTLPQSGAQGRWIATDITITDTVGNRVHHSRTASALQWPLPNIYFVNGQDDIQSAFLPFTSAAPGQDVVPDKPLFFNEALLQRCDPNAGVTYVQGRTFVDGVPSNGHWVAFSYATDGPVVAEIQSGPHQGYPGWNTGYYSHILGSNGPREGNWFFWIKDSSGKRISQIAKVQTDGVAGDGRCQQAVINFYAQR